MPVSPIKAVDNNEETFSFDMNAKNTRLSDRDLLSALEDYAKVVSFRCFPAIEFDNWPNRRCQSRTTGERAIQTFRRDALSHWVCGGRS
jgi:hypothetical protein